MGRNVMRPYRNQVRSIPTSGLPYLNLPNESLWVDIAVRGLIKYIWHPLAKVLRFETVLNQNAHRYISDYYAVVKSVHPKPWAYFHGALWRIRPVISTNILQIAQEVKVIARRGNILDVETIS
ncbi:MAG: hypothetical protein AAF722_14370 [Cyanobacteria bacterium P01_C01_bin.70]